MKVKNMEEWHRIVCSEANYQCQLCKKSFNYPCYFDENGKNQYTVGHHIRRRNVRPDLILETSNGCCLGKKCHDLLHAGKLSLDV